MVGDGSYLMMAQELVTAVAEGFKLTVVLVQNHGYQSIGALSESVGSQRFGTRYRYRGTDDDAARSTSRPTPPASAPRSRGSRRSPTSRRRCATRARRRATTVIHVETDPLVAAPDSEAWWDVPVAETCRARHHARRARALRARQGARSRRT